MALGKKNIKRVLTSEEEATALVALRKLRKLMREFHLRTKDIIPLVKPDKVALDEKGAVANISIEYDTEDGEVFPIRQTADMEGIGLTHFQLGILYFKTGILMFTEQDNDFPDSLIALLEALGLPKKGRE